MLMTDDQRARNRTLKLQQIEKFLGLGAPVEAVSVRASLPDNPEAARL
jgi:hypothetical protein